MNGKKRCGTNDLLTSVGRILPMVDKSRISRNNSYSKRSWCRSTSCFSSPKASRAIVMTATLLFSAIGKSGFELKTK